MGKELVHNGNLLPLACSAQRASRTKLMALESKGMDYIMIGKFFKSESMGMMVLSNGKRSPPFLVRLVPI